MSTFIRHSLINNLEYALFVQYKNNTFDKASLWYFGEYHSDLIRDIDLSVCKDIDKIKQFA